MLFPASQPLRKSPTCSDTTLPVLQSSSGAMPQGSPATLASVERSPFLRNIFWWPTMENDTKLLSVPVPLVPGARPLTTLLQVFTPLFPSLDVHGHILLWTLLLDSLSQKVAQSF